MFSPCSKGSIPPVDLEQQYGDDIDYLMAKLKLLEGDKDVRMCVIIMCVCVV